MEITDIFSFLIILKESIKLVPKNFKLIASITILSLILPSILLLSFIQFHQSIMDCITASFSEPDSTSDINKLFRNELKYLAVLLLVEIAFLLVYFAISHISGIATILVSSASYTDRNLSLNDLISSIKRTWRKPLSTKFNNSRNSLSPYLSIVLGFVVYLTFVYPNFLTISIAVIMGTIVVVFQLYSSVVWVISYVISVVEESSSKEAMEKAEKLVKGNHMKGFMLNLFVNLLFLIVFGLVFVLAYKGSLSWTTYGLLFVNVFSIVKIVLLMAYTVLYFQCKKEHGEEIDVHGDLEYSKLPTSINVGNDIP